MASIEWNVVAQRNLRKLPKEVAARIVAKMENEVRFDPERFLESLEGKPYKKVRVGEYRVFVEYDRAKDHVHVLTVRHRRNAYTR